MKKDIHVLFVDSTHDRLPEKLTQSGFICDYQPDIKPNEIINIIPKYDGIIIRSKIKGQLIWNTVRNQ